jgi:hypothetical protein
MLQNMMSLVHLAEAIEKIKMAVSGMHRFTEYAIVGLMMEGAYHFLKYYLQIYAYTTAHIVSIDAQMT